MSHLGCPACRLRFSAPTAALLSSCPACGGAPVLLSPAELLGFGLFDPPEITPPLPMAQAVALPLPDHLQPYR